MHSVDNSIHDRYLSLTRSQDITSYFKQHYHDEFKQYEKTAIDNLAQNLLFEFMGFLAQSHIPADTWDSTGVIIPYQQINNFNHFFATKSFNDIMTFLRDDSVEDDAIMQVKPKQAFLEGLREMVKQKLLNELYYLSISELHRYDQQTLNTLRLSYAVSHQELIKINQILTNNNLHNLNSTIIILKKNHQIILDYPAIFIQHIHQSPHLIYCLPKELKTHCFFIESLVTELDRLLCDALDEDKINELTDCLLSLVSHEPEYLDNLSPSLLEKRAFAMRLVERNGLFLNKVPFFKNDDDIIYAALKENSDAILYIKASDEIREDYQALFEQLPPDFHSSFPSPASNSQNRLDNTLKNIKKMQAICTLLEPGSVSFLTVHALTREITPPLLIKIASYRAEQGYPPLPYCDNPSILEKFYDESCTNPLDWDSQGYLFVKKQAVHLNANDKTAAAYLSKTNSWYTALIQYKEDQKKLSFRSWNDVIEQLQSVINALGKLAWDIVLILTVIALHVSILILIEFLYIGTTTLIAILMFEALQTVLAGIYLEITFVLSFVILSGASAFFFVYLLNNSPRPDSLLRFMDQTVQNVQFFNSMRDLVGSFILLISNIYATIHAFCETLLPDNRDLQTRCEHSIERLTLMGQESANEKGGLLENIWNKIQNDTEQGDLAVCLTKNYPVIYRGQQRELSFSDVAAARRLDSERFDLDCEAPKSCFSFFMNRPTTTAELLRPEMPAPAA